MEIISTIQSHIANMISFFTFIHGKHGNICKKNSNNKEIPNNSHIYFYPIQKEIALGGTAKPLGG
jgi:hypothetical protein